MKTKTNGFNPGNDNNKKIFSYTKIPEHAETRPEAKKETFLPIPWEAWSNVLDACCCKCQHKDILSLNQSCCRWCILLVDNDSSKQHNWKHDSSLIQTETQHSVDNNNKSAPIILQTENYKPSCTSKGSFEFEVFVWTGATLHAFSKGNMWRWVVFTSRILQEKFLSQGWLNARRVKLLSQTFTSKQTPKTQCCVG